MFRIKKQTTCAVFVNIFDKMTQKYEHLGKKNLSLYGLLKEDQYSGKAEKRSIRD